MNREEFDYLLAENPASPALAPYKMENAVIMAAGFSSRFRPLSDICPKSLLPVKGDVLMERQIRQLQEARIENIYVVVGYKKEMFLPLEAKYGVHVIENPEYTVKNNISTLYTVRPYLGNTYICSSDNYFPENPFSSHEFCAYYSACYAKGSTDEYCLATDDNGRISQVTIGGENSWYMCGHACFDRKFSQQFAAFLESDYTLPGRENYYWENLYMDHIEELDLKMKKFSSNHILEFDTLEELQQFDPFYAEHSLEEIMDYLQKFYSAAV